MRAISTYLLLFTFYFTSAQVLQKDEVFMLVGTYNTPGTDGIYVYAFNSKNANSRLISSIPVNNPSYLAISPDKKYVFSVAERDNGQVAAFSFDKSTGKLTYINQQSSKGANPCFVDVSGNGKWLAVGNYSSGTAAILPIQQNGSLDSAVMVVKHTGSSINSSRQQSPHVHATVFSADQQFLLVPDLGIDKVMIYHFNKEDGQLSPASPAAAKLQPGAGPRHIAFHPEQKSVYVIEELTGMITGFSYRNGEMLSFQRISTHPQKYNGAFGSADIHISPDGKFLYASNRGDANSIAVFTINNTGGMLMNKQFISSGGIAPRNFNFSPDAKYVVVANQKTNNLVIFKRKTGNGLLKKTNKKTELPAAPVCVKWIE